MKDAKTKALKKKYEPSKAQAKKNAKFLGETFKEPTKIKSYMRHGFNSRWPSPEDVFGR